MTIQDAIKKTKDNDYKVDKLTPSEKADIVWLMVQEYLKNKDTLSAMDFSFMPKKILKQDSLAFGRFKYSKENWEQELKIGKRWAKIVKKASPKIYQKIYQEFKKDMDEMYNKKHK